jgi:hypothetical protein
MSARNGEKARAAIEKRRRAAQRLKDRAARPGNKTAAAADQKGKKS